MFFYLGVFLISSSMLILQIVETRILSVISWYHVAFLIVGLSMLGLTAGAVKVYTKASRYREETIFRDLANASNIFAVTMVISMLIQMVVPIIGFGPAGLDLVFWILTSLLVAVPFYFCGIVLSLALTRSPFPVARVYAVDLVGAAIGCLAVLVLLNTTDAPASILWASVLASLAAFSFSRASASPDGNEKRASRRGSIILAALLVIAGINSLAGGIVRPLFVKGVAETGDNVPQFEQWNSFSRITVMPDHLAPAMLWGPSPLFDGAKWTIEQRRHEIDVVASTPAYKIEGDLGKVGFLDYDVTNIAYALPGIDRVAVVGIGAGRDMIAAKYYGASSVTGIEINPILVDLLYKHDNYADFIGVRELDGIEVHVDEARNWFARSKRSFDLIQMSMIDTWAATGAGAFTLSENGLYTVEGWATFLNRLEPDGFLTVSRHYAPTLTLETGRMISLAMAAGMDAGYAAPSKHIFVAASGNVATLVFSRAPFSEPQIAALKRHAETYQYRILLTPDEAPEAGVLRQLTEAKSVAGLVRISGGTLLDLSPPTDDRPFFFNQLPFATAFALLAGTEGRRGNDVLGDATGGILTGNLEATQTLLFLFVLACFYVASTILVPLRPSRRDMSLRLAFSGTAYFALIGFGFMLIEIGLLQKFSIFLGHPVYGLSIVLFSIILSTGIGSALSGSDIVIGRARFSLWAGLTVAYVIFLAFGSQRILLANDDAGLLARALISMALIAPAGLLMGFAFPTGMRLVMSQNRSPAPWFWGINGATGVIASIVAIAISISYGISATLTVGALCYLGLIPAALTLGFRKPPTAQPSP